MTSDNSSGCRDIFHEATKRGVHVTDGVNTFIGAKVTYECACSKERLKGPTHAVCGTSKMWEPRDLPTCESDWLAPLSNREYVMLGFATLCLLTLLVLTTALFVARRRKQKHLMKTTQRVSDKLKGLGDSDPLDDIIRREVARRESAKLTKAARDVLASQSLSREGRQFYRVWNHDGSQKEKLMAISLQELIDEATRRFQLTTPVAIVLELDGKSIRTTEELTTHAGKLLVALAPGQEWQPIRGQNQWASSQSLHRSQSNGASTATLMSSSSSPVQAPEPDGSINCNDDYDNEDDFDAPPHMRAGRASLGGGASSRRSKMDNGHQTGDGNGVSEVTSRAKAMLTNSQSPPYSSTSSSLSLSSSSSSSSSPSSPTAMRTTTIATAPQTHIYTIETPDSLSASEIGDRSFPVVAHMDEKF